MAKQTALYLPKQANNQSVTFVNADSFTPKLCFTAGADDSDVKAIIVTSNDTAAMNIQLWIVRGGVDYLLGTINIPTLSGTNGTVVSVDLINAVGIPGLPVDSAGKRYLPLKSGDTLKTNPLVAVTAAKTVWVSVLGQDY